MAVKQVLCKRYFWPHAISFSSSTHPALQTVALVIKTVYQNAICVLPARFRKMTVFYKSEEHLMPIGSFHWEEIQRSHLQPKSIWVGNYWHRQKAFRSMAVYSVQLPSSPSARQVTATVATWTIMCKFFWSYRSFFVYLQMVRNPHPTCLTSNPAQLLWLPLIFPSLGTQPAGFAALWPPTCEVLSTL